MIHSLKFENFFSFAEETEISFMMDGRASPNDRSAPSAVCNDRISKVLAVVGANGAGKTNVLKPFSFITWFISKSFYREVKDDHLVHTNFYTKSNISKFTIEFEIEKRFFRYNLEITRKRVVSELLFEKTSRLWSNLFIREWDEKTKFYNVTTRNFGLPKKQAEKIKEKVSLISAADQYGVETASLITTYFERTNSNIHAFGRHNFTGFPDVISVTSYYQENDHHKQLMAKLLREWDFGLADVIIEKYETLDQSGKEIEVAMPFGVHHHGDKTYKVPLGAESSGTQAAYFLLTKLLPVLEHGGTVIYDELESDLHPLMLEPILALFFNPKTNPRNAQIIFTTHSLEILNELQKCQIVLVEKNNGLSEAWRLADMEGVRSDENFYAKYMSGTYGAIPQL